MHYVSIYDLPFSFPLSRYDTYAESLPAGISWRNLSLESYLLDELASATPRYSDLNPPAHAPHLATPDNPLGAPNPCSAPYAFPLRPAFYGFTQPRDSDSETDTDDYDDDDDESSENGHDHTTHTGGGGRGIYLSRSRVAIAVLGQLGASRGGCLLRRTAGLRALYSTSSGSDGGSDVGGGDEGGGGEGGGEGGGGGGGGDGGGEGGGDDGGGVGGGGDGGRGISPSPPPGIPRGTLPSTFADRDDNTGGGQLENIAGRPSNASDDNTAGGQRVDTGGGALDASGENTGGGPLADTGGEPLDAAGLWEAAAGGLGSGVAGLQVIYIYRYRYRYRVNPRGRERDRGLGLTP